jgi:hypothetical protein
MAMKQKLLGVILEARLFRDERLTAAIGQLYGTFSEEEIRSLLKVQDMQADDMTLLKRVIDSGPGIDNL